MGGGGAGVGICPSLAFKKISSRASAFGLNLKKISVEIDFNEDYRKKNAYVMSTRERLTYTGVHILEEYKS